MVNIMVMRGVDVTKRAWGAYRQAREEAGLAKAATDRFGYSAFVYVGDTDEEGVRVGSKLLVVRQHQHEIGAAIRRSSCPARPRPNLAPQLYREPEPGGSLGRPGRDRR